MSDGWRIPKFTIDLSVAPERRYAHVVPYFYDEVHDCNLPSLFEEVIESLSGRIFGKCLSTAARFALRRVHSDEETAEIRGISEAMKVPMHCLVALNVLLDVLLGCTSGGVRTSSKSIDSPGSPLDSNSRMLHFRTLDWGMDGLRDLIVELDFVRAQGEPVVATSVTYFGYVGVLTGVRKGLSMSLNFRPYHARTTLKQRLSFRWHQTLVLFGRRQSVSSVLRGYLLESTSNKKTPPGPNRAWRPEKPIQEEDVLEMVSSLTTSQSTAAYIILCRPEKVYIVEKDHKHAFVRESDTFLVAYNHDARDETNPSRLEEATRAMATDDDPTGMLGVLCLSLERKSHMDDMWKQSRKNRRNRGTAVVLNDIIGFFEDPVVRNDETHYAVVMDPTNGKLLWRKAFAVSDSDDYDEEERERLQREGPPRLGLD